jgi:phenylacetic acid degradation operon negative regulatory protein
VTAALSALLDRPGDRWSVLHTRFDDETGPHGPAAAYDLAGLAAEYRAFVDRFSGLRAAVRAGAVEPAAALVARTSIMDCWRRFAVTDPDLPAHLLPPEWPRNEARELMLEVHGALGEPAVARLADIVAPHWASAKEWITYFRAGTDGRPLRADETTGGTSPDP